MKFVYLLCLFLGISCNSKTRQSDQVEVEAKVPSQYVVVQDLKKLDYIHYNLSTASKREVKNWENYQQLNERIKELQSIDFTFFEDEPKALIAFIKELKNQTPKTLNNIPIQNRLVVLETKLLKLNNTLSLKNLPKEDQLESITEFLESFSNLNLQINKKIEFDNNNQFENPI